MKTSRGEEKGEEEAKPHLNILREVFGQASKEQIKPAMGVAPGKGRRGSQLFLLGFWTS